MISIKKTFSKQKDVEAKTFQKQNRGATLT
jgi:hypothetical protein